MKKISLFLFILLFTLVSCSSLKISGTNEPSDEEINAEALKAYTDVKSKSKFSTNKEWNELVQRVVKRIALASGENFQWEAVVIESPEVNAWCMPGGKIAVYTGIMPVLKTEAALAAVLGHEVAHATLRHGKQRYARAMKENIIGMVVGGAVIAGGQFLCKTETCKKLSALGGVATGFAVTFFDRKFSRGDESAADKQGQLYMAKAGYDPSEAPRLWDRMNANHSGKAPPEFMSTHPSDENRKAALNEWMPEAYQLYSQAPHKYGLGVNIN
ncbi:MAG: M48 family metallopeptidase [Bacteriovorax sp.]|nr:M48 family metallopeptidase [Bacteriovorax sp.]